MTKAMNLFYENIQFNSSEISSNKYLERSSKWGYLRKSR